MNEQDKIQKKIFEEEQAHLTQTHGRLRVMENELEERIKLISEKAAQEKKDIRSNLSLNFDSDTDSMETYIEFEAMSHSIDQYNIEQDAAKEKLGRGLLYRKRGSVGERLRASCDRLALAHRGDLLQPGQRPDFLHGRGQARGRGPAAAQAV